MRTALVFLNSTFFAFLAGIGSGCPSGTEGAELCGQQGCPVGTAFSESRSTSMTYDISLGFNPVTYDADGSFASFGTGECEYFCSVIQGCPDGTFPVISDNCFTCGVITYDAQGDPIVSQGSCEQGGDETG